MSRTGMRGAIRPPSIRRHRLVLSATQIIRISVTSCSSDALGCRLTAQSIVSWDSRHLNWNSVVLCMQSAGCSVAGLQSSHCIIDREIKYCCRWNVFPCNRLYRYRLLETPTHDNRYYRTRTVISFWSLHVKSVWCAVTSVVWLVQPLLWSQTSRQDRDCTHNVTSWSVRVTIVTVWKQKIVKCFQCASTFAYFLPPVRLQHIFPTLSHKDAILCKPLLNTKYLVWLSLRICLKHSSFQVEMIEKWSKMHVGLHVQHLLSVAAVCGPSPAEIVGSNPTGGMGVCLLWVMCTVSATSWSLVQRSPTDCDASLCVISKSHEWGGPGHRGGRSATETKNVGQFLFLSDFNQICTMTFSKNTQV